MHKNNDHVWLVRICLLSGKYRREHPCLNQSPHFDRVIGKAGIAQSLYGLASGWTIRIRFSKGAGTSAIATMYVTGLLPNNFIEIVCRYLRVSLLNYEAVLTSTSSVRVMYGTAYVYYELVLTHRCKFM